MKKAKTPITMVTAYDYPSAVHVDIANIDVVLVGDSVGMVELGYDTTLPVTMDEMLHHCRAVARGVSRSIIVGDMPFGLARCLLPCVKLEVSSNFAFFL